jgi:DNA-directed RNA polymerase specialized sigma24 family protein
MVEAADDRAWFEHSVLVVLPELLGTARRLARNREDAEDLAAEAITRAWLHRDGLRERDRFAGWILRILTNPLVTMCRSSWASASASSRRPCACRTPTGECAVVSSFSRPRWPVTMACASPA